MLRLGLEKKITFRIMFGVLVRNKGIDRVHVWLWLKLRITFLIRLVVKFLLIGRFCLGLKSLLVLGLRLRY